MQKETFVRERMPATDSWQCYRRKYGGIHSILVPLFNGKWQWRHCDGVWVETKIFNGTDEADVFMSERYDAIVECTGD